eukprot:gnl/Spiro4/7201_TR3753_c0_g1_i1.p1 gnl/Spiro4/7201_TR3753_c0_g1~~gnl/Spiro4/7201_TR3753_c0_g1_i1.p1  ORF type:complete len:712 (+),score=168.93 gnl/Spiro4/7201_TR3753_c0_g1_i1:30-2138(+)
MGWLLRCALLLLLLHHAVGDIYMHSPRGSNNRNCERNVNRDNANRLFNSQNNDAGGYACPRAVGGPETVTPRMYYYTNSILSIEWTAQHGCGTNPKVRCDIVIQYMCSEPGHAALRDGTPNDVNDAATKTAPEEAASDNNLNYGLHENFAYYDDCRTRASNGGLFRADQLPGPHDARSTRQNNNGNRYGFECPEERDYYPYWHPTPWKDIAVLTYNQSRCSYYQAQSQNVVGKGYCLYTGTDAKPYPWPNTPQLCAAKGYTWTTSSSFGLPPPDCVVSDSMWSRVNHLGNGVNARPLTYNWTIPSSAVNDACVLRIRYNITTTDYAADAALGLPFLNASYNFRQNEASLQNSSIIKIQQDPYITIDTTASPAKFLALARNTNQQGRTFQDRSYVFSIKPRPDSIPGGAKLYNIGVRGKRGNIVQVFPSVEYDFVPNSLYINPGDYVHFQWTGSDYNPRRGCNNGEGGPPDKADNNPALNSRADRSNVIEIVADSDSFPADVTDPTVQSNSMFPDLATLLNHAFLGQTNCLTEAELSAIKNKNERENDPRNCAKLNAAPNGPYFDGKPFAPRTGNHHYYSSRNTNFSNRNQKGYLQVGSNGADTSLSAKQHFVPIEGYKTDLDAITVGQGLENDSGGDGNVMGCGFKASVSADVIPTYAVVILCVVCLGLGSMIGIAGMFLWGVLGPSPTPSPDLSSSLIPRG